MEKIVSFHIYSLQCRSEIHNKFPEIPLISYTEFTMLFNSGIFVLYAPLTQPIDIKLFNIQISNRNIIQLI